MTRQEINASTTATEINWLREIAYQLAKMNEQHEPLADSQPGKRDAEAERGEINDYADPIDPTAKPHDYEKGHRDNPYCCLCGAGMRHRIHQSQPSEPLSAESWHRLYNGAIRQREGLRVVCRELRGELDAANQHVKILQEDVKRLADSQPSKRGRVPEACSSEQAVEMQVLARHLVAVCRSLSDDDEASVRVALLMRRWFPEDPQRSHISEPSTEAGSQPKREFFTSDRRPGDPGYIDPSRLNSDTLADSGVSERDAAGDRRET